MPLKIIASAIIIVFSLNGLINIGITKIVNIWAPKDAKAAPELPRRGIKTIFSATLATAEPRYIQVRYFCLLFETIQAFLATNLALIVLYHY